MGEFNLTFTTLVNKQLFKIPLLKRLEIEACDISKPWMIQLLEKIVKEKKNKAYIDVGVNLADFNEAQIGRP